MQRRQLGRSELEVPVISFGAWAIGGWKWGGTDDAAALEALRLAFDLGMNAVDTAPVYGFGHSERVVGQAIVGRRDKVCVMTKVGLRWDDPEQMGAVFFETADATGRKLAVRKNSRPESLRYEVEQSLARLGVDCLDLVQVHWRDPETPVAETMGALADLREEGKLRAIGVSNYSVSELEQARRALGEVPLASVQPKFNLVAREHERDVLPWAVQAGVGGLVYSPLEQGLLTGRVGPTRTFEGDDGRRNRPTFQSRARKQINALLESVVRPIAVAHGATLAQACLAWTVARPGVTSALVGARRPEQVRENAGAGELRLESDEHSAIDAAFSGLEFEAPLPARVRGRIGRLIARVLR